MSEPAEEPAKRRSASRSSKGSRKVSLAKESPADLADAPPQGAPADGAAAGATPGEAPGPNPFAADVVEVDVEVAAGTIPQPAKGAEVGSGPAGGPQPPIKVVLCGDTPYGWRPADEPQEVWSLYGTWRYGLLELCAAPALFLLHFFLYDFAVLVNLQKVVTVAGEVDLNGIFTLTRQNALIVGIVFILIRVFWTIPFFIFAGRTYGTSMLWIARTWVDVFFAYYILKGVKQRFAIPANDLEDFCLMTWCPCCSWMQVVNHLTDYEVGMRGAGCVGPAVTVAPAAAAAPIAAAPRGAE